MSTQDIVIKQTQRLRIAEASAVAPGPGPDTVGPVFHQLAARVLGALKRSDIPHGMLVGHYEPLRDDGSLVVHVGFEIGPADTVIDTEGVSVVDLPVVTVAAMMHHGPLDTLLESNEQLAHWVRDSGYTMTGLSRELYRQWDDDDPTRNITELQTHLAS